MSNSTKTASRIKTNMKNIIRGIIFCSLLCLSIFTGLFLLMCPILFLVVISPRKYRRWGDFVFGIWEPFPVAVMEVFFGIRVVLSGDQVDPFESSLFVMNHRTRVDWSFLWLAMFHRCQPNAHNLKYILKSSIMQFPGPGWVMQTCSFIFLYRDWSRDKPLLNRIIDYLNESDDLYQVLIFPEGTDFTEKSLNRSHKYADSHNLERYYNVLHPRTTGFAFIANKMRSGGQLNAVYDVTVAYPKTLAQTELDFLKGRIPEEVHFHFNRYNCSKIPNDDEDLKLWLEKIWKQKEQMLEDFYTRGSFLEQENEVNSISNGKVIKNEINSETNNSVSSESDASAERKTSSRSHVTSKEERGSAKHRPSYLLYIVLGFWIILIFFTVYQLIYSFYFQLWVLIHSVFFTGISLFSNGFHHVAASIYFYRYGRKSCDAKKNE